MTNEQLYILLQWIADGLAAEIATLESCLADVPGIERKPNFYDGDGYSRDGFFEAWHGEDVESYARERGLVVRFDGDIVILGGLNHLLRCIRERSGALR
jgi:hypothetical protein